MPVVGVVVTLSDVPRLAAEARNNLSNDPRFTLGPQVGDVLALVIDTPDRAADSAAWEHLLNARGVVHAAPVYADLSDCLPEAEAQ